MNKTQSQRTTPLIVSALAVLRKDLRAELRSRELVSSMGLFALLSILVFSFALELTGPLLSINEELRQINALLESLGETGIEAVDPLNLTAIVSGMFWVTVIFALVLGLSRSLAAEREEGNMDAMLLAPVNRSAIYLGKMLSNFLITVVVGLVLMPVITILFNINLLDPRLLLVMVLGVLGFVSMGTLLATMAVQTRSRETLLPIMMLPTSLPVLLAVVRATNGIIGGQPVDLWGGWVTLIVILDLLYFVMAYVGFPFVIEE